MELFRNFFALIGTGWTVLSKGFDIGHLLIFLIVCVLPVAFFTVQLVVCLKCKKLSQKFIPFYITGFLGQFAIISVLFYEDWGIVVLLASVPVICAMILILLAWAVYGMICAVRGIVRRSVMKHG